MLVSSTPSSNSKNGSRYCQISSRRQNHHPFENHWYRWKEVRSWVRGASQNLKMGEVNREAAKETQGEVEEEIKEYSVPEAKWRKYHRKVTICVKCYCLLGCSRRTLFFFFFFLKGCTGSIWIVPGRGSILIPVGSFNPPRPAGD